MQNECNSLLTAPLPVQTAEALHHPVTQIASAPEINKTSKQSNTPFLPNLSKLSVPDRHINNRAEVSHVNTPA
jgi:hypothetical protein